MTISLIIYGVIFWIILCYSVVTAYHEQQHRAAGIFLCLMFCVPLPYFLFAVLNFPGKLIIVWILLVIPVLSVVLLLFPSSTRPEIQASTPTARIDERDTMFSRQELQPGSSRYERYYKNHPAAKLTDDTFRMYPGLLAPNTRYYHACAFQAAQASFDTIKSLRAHVNGKVAPQRVDLNAREITPFIKHWAHQLGALDIGITRLKPYHLYSYGGRDDRYGKPIKAEHEFAIALSVPMAWEMMRYAPRAPVVMESARQYVNVGVIALQLAAFIRNLGYEARAHIDGNYELVCPLVARDAGLGDIGRMGLLMTPRQGPRIRLSVVTTNLPLICDQNGFEPSLIDFCEQCQKCARNCPAQAIPFGPRQEIKGALRWQINSEACFTHWTKIGTDCGRCIQVCPYAHPDNLFHNVIRRLIKFSPLLRSWAVILDDISYGQRPPVPPLPAWIRHDQCRAKKSKKQLHKA